MKLTPTDHLSILSMATALACAKSDRDHDFRTGCQTFVSSPTELPEYRELVNYLIDMEDES